MIKGDKSNIQSLLAVRLGEEQISKNIKIIHKTYQKYVH